MNLPSTRAQPRSFAFCLLLAVFLAACSGSSSGRSYYIDCESMTASEGTSDEPWNNFEIANSLTLEPGDRLLLRRGTVCNGMLKPRGSGTEDNPIVISAYGDGPLPRIDAQGMFTAAVHIEDNSHVVIESLELTNPGDVNDTDRYRGVYLSSVESTVSNIEIRDLYIHDVTSRVDFGGGKLGGAIVAISSLEAPEAAFDGILIENNRIEDVGRSGIYFDGTSFSDERPRATEPWPRGAQGVVIRGNTLERLQGDAIVAHGTEGTVIEDNVVSVGNLAGKDFASEDRNCAVGIWTWHANNTLIQRNEVSGYRFGQSATDGCDGTGFGRDYNTDGTIIQYNYSHDNEGGFILLCSDDEPNRADVRYNLSIDDGKAINASPCKFPTPGTYDELRMYNNTFVMPDPHTALQNARLSTIGNAGDFQFANNIVYATSPQTEPMACGDRCTNNLFYNLPPSGTEFVLEDPLFEDGSWRGSGRAEAGEAFRIRTGSAAVAAGLGLVIPPPEEDYFGNEIPATPSIGMHQLN